jgi:fumarate hydratase class II
MAPTTRPEHDSFGLIDVPATALWGAQTQRSLTYFRISTEIMPEALLRALALVKRSCAASNGTLGLLDEQTTRAIMAAADEVLEGLHDSAFPLSVWQTGSGTQTNMNMNEVLANRASELLGGTRGNDRQVHPNDQVNLGQSSNDIFPTAMHVAAATLLTGQLLPALKALRGALASKSADFQGVIQDRADSPAGCNTAHIGAGIFRLGRPTGLRRAGDHCEFTRTLRTCSRRHRSGNGAEYSSRFRQEGSE